MDKKEFAEKYFNLRILKSIQEYFKSDDNSLSTVYPVRIPGDLLYQLVKERGPKNSDDIIHQIFKLGLSLWSEELFNVTFGSEESLEEFIESLKKKNKENT